MPRLTPDRAESCDGALTVEECLKSISGMKPHKTPGSDGLPMEFYKHFFHLFGVDFVNSINNAHVEGLLTPSQRTGYITLLCKNPNQADLLTNWRPVSLLNVDYKIISKALANRLRSVLEDSIHSDQTCSIPGRSIADNLHLIRNIYDYCKYRIAPCFLTSFDQIKAFDRISHEYLFHILSRFGFNDSFITWIRLLYTDISSCVFINGFLSESFNILRSVRQGCGLSPLLYVLCIEPLAHLIRTSMNIRGLKLPGTAEEIRISLYADDSTTVAVDTPSVVETVEIFNNFGLASGAQLNLSKCAILIIGSPASLGSLPAMLPIVPDLKICGVYFGDNMIAKNESMIYEKLNKTVQLYKSRALTLRGKVTLINVMLCAKIWYVGSCILFTEQWLTKVNQLFFQFLWRKTGQNGLIASLW